MATTYHTLGVVAQDRRRLDEAEEWYRRALRIEEDLDDRPRMADTCHELERVAWARGRTDEAMEWSRRAFRINEGLLTGERWPPLADD